MNPEQRLNALQDRVKELEIENELLKSDASIKHKYRADCLERENAALCKVVDEARELVFGKSADSVDTDEHPELEAALHELYGF